MLLLAAIAVPLVPALSFALLAALRRPLGERSGWVAVGGVALSTIAALYLLAQTWLAAPEEGAPVLHATVLWARMGEIAVRFGVLLDGLSAPVLAMVALVALMVFVYATGYMHGDPRFGWFFSVFSLFLACMFGVVLSANLLQLMVFWEVMGLCSYLLIGFWYERGEARAAAIKAFLTTRVGDMGFLVGVILLLNRFHTLDFTQLARIAEESGAAERGFLTLACLCLFWGAVGKSAQFPLHFWLPHAMAGPTPVSGLLHSATMVAAGVFLVARTYPLFLASSALPWVAAAGMFSALFAAILALSETDIKRTFAYSTMSQLGYMMAALGVGGLVGAVFHLITHGFFKSLLFLGAGSVIHGVETQDVREMGGLRKAMPTTAITLLIGSMALAGVPPLAGFFSKDEILLSVFTSHIVSRPLAILLFVMGLGTAMLTAFYTFRVFFVVFLGEQKAHAHESPPKMTVPLKVLATFTALAGAINLPIGLALLTHLVAPGEHLAPSLIVMGLSVFAAASGTLLAYWHCHDTCGFQVTEHALVARLQRFTGRIFVSPAYETSLLLRRLNVDGIADALVIRPVFAVSTAMRFVEVDVAYDFMFERVVRWVAERLTVFDAEVVDGSITQAGKAGAHAVSAALRFDLSGVDGAVNGVGDTTMALGKRFRKLQTGALSNYALFMLLFGVLIFYVARWLGR